MLLWKEAMKKTLLDLYSREKIRDLHKIAATRKFGYSPIVFVCEKDGDASFLSKCLSKLFDAALTETNKEFPDFLQYEWIKGKGYFNELRFISKHFAEGIKRFWHNLELFADSKKLGARKNSFGWKDVKDLFFEISTSDIAFLNGEKMNYIDKNSSSLFAACEEIDLQKITESIKNGADVNSFDNDGDTPLCFLLDSAECAVIDGCYGSDDKASFTKKVLKCLLFLIKNGADVNLFGFGGSDALTNAHFYGDPKVMEFLLQKGARLDLNCYVTDLDDWGQWYIRNSAYDFCITDRACGDLYNDDCGKQIELLEKYGVTYFIDGWSAEKIDDYYKLDFKRRPNE